jgi:hypothetical protein
MKAVTLLHELVAANRLTTQRKRPVLLRDQGDWAFPVPDHFAAPAGVENDPADGETPTQGVLFQFATGDILYDHASGYTQTWTEASNFVRRTVQVLDAVSVSASSKDLRAEADAGARIPRNAGRVTFSLSEHKRAEPVSKSRHTITQDGFMEFLMTGEVPKGSG